MNLDFLDSHAENFKLPEDGPKHYVFKRDVSDPTVIHFYIDNSSLERFQTCPRSAENYIIQRRESNSPRRPLDFGAAIHEGLASFMRGDSIEAALEHLHNRLDSCQPCSPTEWRTAENAEKLLCGWVEAHAPFRFRPVINDGQVVVETPFDIVIAELPIDGLFPCPPSLLFGSESSYGELGLDLSEPPATYCSTVIVHWTGRIDAIVTHDDHPGVWVLDHKTTSIGGPTYYSQFNLSQQMLGYCYAAKKIFGIEPAGLLLDTLFNRQPTKTGKSQEFNITPFPYESYQYDEWVDDVRHFVADFIANLLRGFFPKSTAWCFGKYGACPYHTACTLPPAERQMLLASPSFRNVTWNPLA